MSEKFVCFTFLLEKKNVIKTKKILYCPWLALLKRLFARLIWPLVAYLPNYQENGYLFAKFI